MRVFVIMSILKDFEMLNISVIFLLSDHTLHPIFSFGSIAILIFDFLKRSQVIYFLRIIFFWLLTRYFARSLIIA